MSGMTFVACRLAAIAAAAALLAGCGGGDISSAQLASATSTDVKVRTPLVDDDGWPMPADPPPAHAAPPAAAHGQATR